MNDSEHECDVIMWITDIYEYDMDYMMDKKDRYDSVYMIEKLNIHDMNDMIEMYYMKEKQTWYVKCEWERWLWHDRDMCMWYVWYEWKERGTWVWYDWAW